MVYKDKILEISYTICYTISYTIVKMIICYSLLLLTGQYFRILYVYQQRLPNYINITIIIIIRLLQLVILISQQVLLPELDRKSIQYYYIIIDYLIISYYYYLLQHQQYYTYLFSISCYLQLYSYKGEVGYITFIRESYQTYYLFIQVILLQEVLLIRVRAIVEIIID